MAFSAGKSAAFYINGLNLSAYFREVSLSGSRDLGDTSAYGNSTHTYLPTLRNGTLSAEGYSDGTASGIDAKLQSFDTDTNTIYTFWYAGDAQGNSGWAMQAEQSEFGTTTPVDGIVTVSTTAQSDVGMEGVKSIHALGAETSFPATGTTLDSGAGTTNGGSAYLHVTAFTGTDVTISIRHSTDNFSASDDQLVAFTATTSAPSAQRVTFTGTVRQYVRVYVTTSGGATSVTFNVGIHRA